jgi:hypothetical protein
MALGKLVAWRRRRSQFAVLRARAVISHGEDLPPAGLFCLMISTWSHVPPKQLTNALLSRSCPVTAGANLPPLPYVPVGEDYPNRRRQWLFGSLGEKAIHTTSENRERYRPRWQLPQPVILRSQTSSDMVAESYRVYAIDISRKLLATDQIHPKPRFVR